MAHGIDLMSKDKIVMDSSKRKFRIPSPNNLIKPPADIQFGRKSKPWRIYFAMLKSVLPVFFLLYSSLFIILGLINLDPIVTLTGGICSLPLIIIIIRLHRPKLIHVKIATPSENGRFIHPLPNGGSLQTNVKTDFKRFLIRDDSVLEMPPSKQLWLIFSLVVFVGIILSLLFLTKNPQDSDLNIGYLPSNIGVILFIIIAIPLWIIGFSLPVLTWWGTSTQLLGITTRKRDAESWLLAGMVAAFPAFLFNSFIAPLMLPASVSILVKDLALLAIFAPLCEELFKGIAVAFFLPSIKGPKHGFQIGFTIGLGFALIENFQYIGLSLIGGPLQITMTILIRGIGSIPGHAVWTAITGTAIGWSVIDSNYVNKYNNKEKMAFNDADYSIFDPLDVGNSGKSLDKLNDKRPWSLLDKNSEVINNQIPVDKLEKKYVNSGFYSPKSIIKALILSILGHSFWNGSSYFSFYLPEENNLAPNMVIFISFVWTSILIITMLYTTIQLLRGIRSLDIEN